MDAINFELTPTEYQNLRQMTDIVRGNLGNYTSNSTGFLEWKYVISSIWRRFRDERYYWKNLEFLFEVYEVESMIYMINYLNQGKFNLSLIKKLQNSLADYWIEPIGEHKSFLSWYSANRFMQMMFDNKKFENMDDFEQEYLKELFAEINAKNSTP